MSKCKKIVFLHLLFLKKNETKNNVLNYKNKLILFQKK